MAFKLVQARIDLAIIQSSRALPDGLEQKWCGFNAENVEHDVWSRAIVPATYNVTVADGGD